MRKKIIAFFTGAMIVGALASGQASAAEVYKVQPGDSLWKISQKHGTSIQQLKSWNNLSSDLIFPNQKLHISADAAVNKEKNIDDVGFIKALIERLFSARIENETFQQRIAAGASLFQ